MQGARPRPSHIYSISLNFINILLKIHTDFILDCYGETMLDYLFEKEKARLLYKSLKPVFCPALQDWVHFNDHGFRHILVKNNRTRPKSDQIRRFRLLPRARKVISGAITYVYRQGKHDASFWSVTDGKIKILIRQINTGQKHFFSIMD